MCTKVWHDPSSLRRGREPPDRHLSSVRSQCRSTEVEACDWPLCQALRPDSRTVAEATVAHLVVMPRVVRPRAFYVASPPEGRLLAGRISRAQLWRIVNNSPGVIPERVAPVHTARDAPCGVCPKAYAVWPARRLCRQLALGASWVRCCRSNERLAFRTSRIAVWVPRTVIHVAFRKRSAGASRRARPASQGMGFASRGKLASALASTASCSHKPPYSAFAGRWCS